MLKLFASFVLFFFLFLPMSAGAVNIGDMLLPFAGTDMQGKPVDLTTVIGKQPVMLVFWASWCPNCKVEVPKINKLYEKYSPQGMTFLGINVGFNDTVGRAAAFVELTKTAYPVFFDNKSVVTKKYKIQGVPTILMADKSGRVVFRNFIAPEISDQDFKELSR